MRSPIRTSRAIRAGLLGLLCLTVSGCFLQPVTRIEREFNFVDYDAPALRLARPVKAYLLAKDPKTGKWVPIGRGLVPAGAYVKGRAPANKDIEDELRGN